MPVHEGLADRFAIQDVLVRYAQCMDTRDWDLLRDQVFIEACAVNYPGALLLEGVDKVWRYCERALRPFDATQHLLGNYDIQVDGDRATSVCRLQAAHIAQTGDGDLVFTLGGNYTDEFVRTPGGWRIARRTLTTEWTETTGPS